MTSPPRPTSPTVDAAQDLAAMAGQKLGNYRLERLVGRGRMGAVYLAKDEALLRPTAVKILSWRTGAAAGVDPVQWFLSEARLVARINHPRVIQIYGAARQGDLCYMAMEYVAGPSAATAIEQQGRMPVEAATDVLVQAASALAAAHRCGVIHRDVKPANLLLGPGGATKLGDFGMALGPTDLGTGKAHLRVGTPLYTAPELWLGEIASPAADLYALGATYFQLLTGRPPFPGPDLAQVENAHLRAPVPDPRSLVPELPAACAALIRRVLAKDPRDRQHGAEDLAWEGRHILQALAAGGQGRAAELGEAQDAPALPGWAQRLGFRRPPFADAGLEVPYLGEPFGKLRSLLASRLESDATVLLALTGGPGSGRTTLCRRVAAELGGERLVVMGDGASDAGVEALVQRACRVSAGSEGSSASLEGMVERLVEERRRTGRRPQLFLDGVGATPPALVLRIAQAAAATRAFGLLLVGAPGLGAALTRGAVPLPGGVPELEVPPLGREQVLAYVRSWLAATLDPDAPALLFTPDALLLLAMRSGGALGRINRLAENVLVAAAIEGRRVIGSFHAWSVPERDRWAERAPAEPLRRPASWPPPDVVRTINACRRATGMRPYPTPEPEVRASDETPRD